MSKLFFNINKYHFVPQKIFKRKTILDTYCQDWHKFTLVLLFQHMNQWIGIFFVIRKEKKNAVFGVK